MPAAASPPRSARRTLTTLAAIRSFVPPAAAAIAIAGFSWLGLWQLERAGEKERLVEMFAERTADAPILLNERLSPMPSGFDSDWWRYRRVEVSGEISGARQYLLDNRTRNGIAGYQVHVPMLVSGLGRLVLVNRGWVEAGPSRERLPDVSLGDSEVVISGIVEYPRRTLLLGDDGYASSSWPKVVQWIDLDKTARDLDRQVLPFVVLLDAKLPHGFVREWTPYLGIGPERHQAYALQWFSLAVAVAVVWIVLKVRGARRH